jgi:hypothetical protein
MPAKENCASAWANHTAGRSAQNGGSRTATLDISAGGKLSPVSSVRRRGHIITYPPEEDPQAYD